MEKLLNLALDHRSSTICSIRHLVRIISYSDYGTSKCLLCSTIEVNSLPHHIVDVHTKSRSS